MQVPFKKMHGTGNAILVVDQRESSIAAPGASALRKLSDPATGPGFDQMMWVERAAEQNCVARYRVFNADGSEVEQCGNGVRCIAKYLHLEDAQQQAIQLQSPAGTVEAVVHADGLVSVSMGRPKFEPDEIPFFAHERTSEYELECGDKSLVVSALSMGNPHCVLWVDNAAAAPVGELGPIIEQHSRFPNRTNVGFMQILDRHSIALRVHERGVGETLACGTGACAAVVAGITHGALEREVQVRLPGGEVVVSWRGDSDPVWLKGNAEVVSDGTLEL